MPSYQVKTDPSSMDIDYIHRFLSEQSSWSRGIPRHKVEASVHHSLNFGLYCDDRQIGYARVISDHATIAYLGDVFIDEAYRGKGLSRLLMDAVFSHPDLQGLRRWILLTSTAHGLYAKYGFRPLPNASLYMERHDAGVYQR